MDRVSEDTNICSATQDNYLQTNDNKVQIPHYCQVVRFTDTKGNTKEMFFPKSLDLERPKRARTNFTARQLESLEKAFAKNQYLVGKERKLLSAELDLSESQIKIWYQNRRTKYKRELFKEKERLEAKAESIATSNIMKLLQHKSQSRDPVVTRLKSNNPFFYNNCLWNDTNYFSDVYSTSILHK